MGFHEDFDCIIIWLNKRGYKVYMGSDAQDSVQYGPKRIYLNSRQHIQNRLYALLHECGHILVNDNRDRVYKLSYQATGEGRVRPSKQKRVAILAEEFEAWKRGERLAARLGVEINIEKYDQERTKAIMSYVEWVDA
jgi:hypothetical protein